MSHIFGYNHTYLSGNLSRFLDDPVVPVIGGKGWARHRLAVPLLISILVHAGLLSSMPNLWNSAAQRPNPLRALQVKLTLPEEPTAVLPAPSHNAPRKATPQPAVTKPAAPELESRETVRPLPVHASAPVGLADPRTLENAPSIPGEEPPAPLAPPAAQAAAPSISSNRIAVQLDQAALDGYGLALSKTFSKFQRYPRLAQIRHWQGKVQVSLQIAAGGKLISASVSRSSGYEILDQQALEIVKQANPLPQVPEALQAKTFTVIVPILFRLENS